MIHFHNNIIILNLEIYLIEETNVVFIWVVFPNLFIKIKMYNDIVFFILIN